MYLTSIFSLAWHRKAKYLHSGFFRIKTLCVSFFVYFLLTFYKIFAVSILSILPISSLAQEAGEILEEAWITTSESFSSFSATKDFIGVMSLDWELESCWGGISLVMKSLPSIKKFWECRPLGLIFIFFFLLLQSLSGKLYLNQDRNVFMNFPQNTKFLQR